MLVRASSGSSGGGGYGIVPTSGDEYAYALITGSGLNATATNSKYPQLGYDVSKVNSLSIQYASNNTSGGYNRGTFGYTLDGTDGVVCDGTAHSTTAQTKTIDLTGKNSLVFYGMDDQNPNAFGGLFVGKITFS